MCNRASDARCAGVPNLGGIEDELEDFLPQLCGGSCWEAFESSSGPELTARDRGIDGLLTARRGGKARTLCNLCSLFCNPSTSNSASTAAQPSRGVGSRCHHDEDSEHKQTRAQHRRVEKAAKEAWPAPDERWLQRYGERSGLSDVATLRMLTHMILRQTIVPWPKSLVDSSRHEIT